MGLFDQLNIGPQSAPKQAQGNPMQGMQQEVGQLKAHPCASLKNRGFNIPDGMTDAEQITRYLLQTGQIGNSRLQAVMKMFGA